MDLIKVKPIDVWKSAAGLCLICGMPLALEQEGKHMKEGASSKENAGDGDSSLQNMMEALDLTGEIKENFVRVALFQHNLLGSVEKCHIIDKYTFLKGYEQFKKALKDNSTVVEALGGNLYRSVFFMIYY